MVIDNFMSEAGIFLHKFIFSIYESQLYYKSDNYDTTYADKKRENPVSDRFNFFKSHKNW